MKKKKKVLEVLGRLIGITTLFYGIGIFCFSMVFIILLENYPQLLDKSVDFDILNITISISIKIGLIILMCIVGLMLERQLFEPKRIY